MGETARPTLAEASARTWGPEKVVSLNMAKIGLRHEAAEFNNEAWLPCTFELYPAGIYGMLTSALFGEIDTVIVQSHRRT